MMSASICKQYLADLRIKYNYKVLMLNECFAYIIFKGRCSVVHWGQAPGSNPKMRFKVQRLNLFVPTILSQVYVVN